jgi:soluble lytic murein transglycosylase-like protein
MVRIPIFCAAALIACPTCFARPAARPTAYDEIIARQAKEHGLPESFVHRTVMRESGYNPRLVHRHCYGLMQIKYPTARSMGYQGDPRGLLDPKTNLTYAVPYLANAYRLADGDEDRATALYRSGYYYLAKRKRMSATLQTASSSPLAPEPAPVEEPEPPSNPLSGLLSFLAGPSDAPPPDPPPQSSE